MRGVQGARVYAGGREPLEPDSIAAFGPDTTDRDGELTAAISTPSASHDGGSAAAEVHRQHRAGGLLLHQLAACGHHVERIVEGHHAGQVRGDVFADAVASIACGTTPQCCHNVASA